MLQPLSRYNLPRYLCSEAFRKPCFMNLERAWPGFSRWPLHWRLLPVEVRTPLCRETPSHSTALRRTVVTVVSHSAARASQRFKAVPHSVLPWDQEHRPESGQGKAVLCLPLMFTAFSSSLLPVLHSPSLSFLFLPLHHLPSLPGPNRNDISPTPHAWRGLCLWKAEAYAWQVTHELCNMVALSSGRLDIPKHILVWFGLVFFCFYCPNRK